MDPGLQEELRQAEEDHEAWRREEGLEDEDEDDDEDEDFKTRAIIAEHSLQRVRALFQLEKERAEQVGGVGGRFSRREIYLEGGVRAQNPEEQAGGGEGAAVRLALERVLIQPQKEHAAQVGGGERAFGRLRQ